MHAYKNHEMHAYKNSEPQGPEDKPATGRLSEADRTAQRPRSAENRQAAAGAEASKVSFTSSRLARSRHLLQVDARSGGWLGMANGKGTIRRVRFSTLSPGLFLGVLSAASAKNAMVRV